MSLTQCTRTATCEYSAGHDGPCSFERADVAELEQAFREGFREAESCSSELVHPNAEHDAVWRWYRRRAGKCDGNHALAVPCADPKCWQKG
jgi:hypothetical protein